MDRYKIALKKKAVFVPPDRKQWKKFIESFLTLQEFLALDLIRARLSKKRGLDMIEGLKYAETRIIMKYSDKNNKGLVPTQALDHALLIIKEEIEIKKDETMKLYQSNDMFDVERRGLGDPHRYVPPEVYIASLGAENRSEVTQMIEQEFPKDLHGRIIL